MPMTDPGPSAARRPEAEVPFPVRLLRWRTYILLQTLGVAVLAVVVSLLLPNLYRARATLLPPQEDVLLLGGLNRSVRSALSSVSGGLSLSGGMNLPMWATPSDILAAILRSRRLREAVIAEHDLIARFEVENVDLALAVFASRSQVGVTGEGIVRVTFIDEDAELAAAVLATSLTELDRIQRETRHSGAAEVRRFVAERLAHAAAELEAIEERQQRFQERHGLLAPEEQARALVEAIAALEAERLAARVEREALLTQVASDHPEVQRLRARGDALAAAIAELEGRGRRVPASSDSARGALIDLGRLPALTLEHLRLYREVEIQAALYALLVQLHEQYRIQEVRDTPTIQVLDAPAVPLEKAKPQRAVLCLLATAMAFVAALGLAAALERLRLLAERDPRRFAHLARLLRGIGLGFVVRGAAD